MNNLTKQTNITKAFQQMPIWKHILAGSLFFFSSLSFAEGRGQETHGGFAYECKKNGRTVVQLQDYEEGVTFKSKLDLGPSNLSEDEKFEFVMKRLERLDPLTADRYRGRYKKFNEERKFVSEEQMVIPGDSTNSVNPDNGCRKKPFVIQIMNPRLNEVRYLINERLYNLASKDVRLGIKLHEFVWTDAFALGHGNSDQFRGYVFNISSDIMLKLQPIEYLQMLEEANLSRRWAPTGSSFSVNFPVQNIFNLQGQKENEMSLVNPQSYQDTSKNQLIIIADSIIPRKESLMTFNGKNLIDMKFARNITISPAKENQFTIVQISNLEGPDEVKYTTRQLQIGNAKILCLKEIQFYPNGNLKSCRLGFQNKIQTPQKMISVMPLSRVHFHPNGALSMVEAAEYNFSHTNKDYLNALQLTWDTRGIFLSEESKVFDLSFKHPSSKCLENLQECTINDLKTFDETDGNPFPQGLRRTSRNESTYR